MNSDVIIVGGGITGLAAAYEFQLQAEATGALLGYTLLEAGPAVGGKIVTERVGGFVIEGGPDSFLAQKPEAAGLCRRLGLGGELIGTNDAGRKVFVVNNGQLEAMPDGVMLIVPTRAWPFVTSRLISWPGKLRMGLELFIPPRRDNADESLGAFVRRRLGGEALDKIAGPMLSGIHSADPEEQSVLATFPRLRELERRHGSLTRGMLAGLADRPTAGPPKPMFVSLRGGTAQLTEALGRALGGRVLRGARAVAVEHADAPDGPPRYRVRCADGSVHEAPALILATPAGASADMLEGTAPGLAAALRDIRYSSTANISLGFRRAALEHPLAGFGFMVPRREPYRIAACTWSSSKLAGRAPDDMVLLRCFLSGPRADGLVRLSDSALVELALADLRQLLGLRAEPQIARVFRWPRANPQYDVGHLERVHAIRALAAQARLDGLLLAGSAYDGVGVPDCIRQGQQAARRAFEMLSGALQPA
ncbi:MAG TPA: protoporphyrinogen oxidase [Roseiflexaceae bacterium]|nr:protoporphyrinogen oxidase [Roseiflexaceae bacterium]